MSTQRTPFARFEPAAFVLTALLWFLLLTNCGGGGGGGGTSPPPASLRITTVSLAEGTLGQTYSQRVIATGGTGAYDWSLNSGSDPLPPGLNMGTTGTISGSPTSNGTYSFTVQVRDSGGRIDTRSITMFVRDPLVILTTHVSGGVSGRGYSFSFDANGGHAPYTWTVSSGSLPPGLTLGSSGKVTGTPNSSGSFNFGVRAQDLDQRTANLAASIDVALALEVTTSTVQDTNVGYNYSAPLNRNGGLPPFQWGLAAGSGPLPPGLTISDNGTYASINGIPTQGGTYSFVVQVTDALTPPQVTTRDLTIFVDNQFNFPTRSLTLGVVGRSYYDRLLAYGGALPYTWRIISGSLPPGIEFNASTGEISGMPTSSITGWTGIEVTDSSDPPQSKQNTIYVPINPPVGFGLSFLPDGVQGRAYYGRPSIYGGKPPYMMRLVSGMLPEGLTLNGGPGDLGSFNFPGTPTTLGEYGFTLEASDSSSPPTTATQAYSVRVVPPLKIRTTTLPEGWTGDPYTVTLSVEGGVPPYWWVNFNPRPQGLTLDQSSGVISGIPREAFNAEAQLSVYDQTRPEQSDFKWVPLRIIARLSVGTSRLPAARPAVPFRAELGVAGGTPPYIWTPSSGSLPAGLSFNPATAEITGTPTTEGTSNFTIQVTDTGPPVQTASRSLSMTVTSNLGRNDSPATATPISNGTFRASISPYADPVAGPANPDHDYYQLTANPGAVVTIETMARRLTPQSFLDTVVEIVDADGNRFTTCRTPDVPYANYDQPCLNDDLNLGILQDSHLEFQAPSEGTSPVMFYVHVFSFNGSARPDYVYDLIVSGAN